MEDNLLANFKNIVFFILLSVITIFFGYILEPFFFAIFWAVLLASIFAPLYKLLNNRLKNPNFSAGLTMAAVLFCLIIPAVLLINLLIAESFDIYKSFDSGSSNWIGTFTATLQSLNENPIFARLNLDQAFWIDKSQEALKAITNYIIQHISSYTQNTIILIVNFAVAIYALFYFLRDGEHLTVNANNYIPVDKKHLDNFVNEFLTTAKAALKFTFVIGGIQGFLGGMLFYITGIDRALIWGVLMIGFSIVPAIGCAIIWVPAGIIMLLLGHTWQGITILVFGSIVISSVDNLLRPVLMGRDIQMHPLLIFLSTLGGIAVLGFSGFIMGPVIAALFLASWKLLPEIYQKQGVKNNE